MSMTMNTRILPVPAVTATGFPEASGGEGRSGEGLATRAVHAGREDFHRLGVHAPPIDLSSTYPVTSLSEGSADLDELAAGGHPLHSPVYSRLYNPGVARFEQALARLEGTEEAVSFGSGMAAMTAVLMAVRQTARHVVAVRPLYGGTDHLLSSRLLDLEVGWAKPEEIGRIRRPDTGLIILETPANPTLALTGLELVAEQAGPVPVLVDNTFATPVLQNPVQFGAAYILHSATKFLGGHGDVLAGVVATNAARARELRQIRVITGNVLHPLAGYLLHRGLPTLPLRVHHAQENARYLAGRLQRHSRVKSVYYPGLGGAGEIDIMRRQMRGPGAVLAFEMAGGYPEAAAVLSSVRLFTPAVSLGSVDSLIQHPAGLTHRLVDEQARHQSGISGGLLRISAGLEDPHDLWSDLSQALERAAG